MKSLVVLLLLAFLVCTVSGKCACTMPTSILDDYETESSPVFKAKAIEKLDVADPHYKYVRFEYNFVFRNCPPPHPDFIVKTPSSEESCGIYFEIGEKYLLSLTKAGGATPLPGAKGRAVYKADSCHVTTKWSDVPFDVANTLYYSEVRGCIA